MTSSDDRQPAHLAPRSTLLLLGVIVVLIISTGVVMAGVAVADGETSSASITGDTVQEDGVDVWFTDVPDEVTAGETAEIEVMLENLDTESTDADVDLLVDGSVVSSSTVSLGENEQESESFEWAPDEDDIGTVDISVETDTHQNSTTATVLESANFELSNFQAPSNVMQHEAFNASVEVENTGEATGTQNVTLTYDDETEVARENVTLDGGASTTVTFENVSIGEVGVLTLNVNSEDDEIDRLISVEETTATRELSSDVVGPGGSIQVTIEATVEEAQDLSLLEEIEPGVESIVVVDDDGADAVTVDTESGTIEAEYSDRERFTLVYRFTVDDEASIGDDYELDGTVTGDESLPLGENTVTVSEDPGVAILDISYPDELVAGEEAEVTISVENLDEESTDTLVSLVADDAFIDDRSISLSAHEQTEVTIIWTPDSAGVAQLDVQTDSHEQTTDVSVLQPATFDITDFTVESPVTQFEPFNATVTIENTGDVTGEQDLHITLDDGTELAIQRVTLDSGETTTVTVGDLVLNTTGTFEIFASTADGGANEVIVVESPVATVTLEEQLLGETSDGDPAVFASGVVADPGWTLVIVDDSDTEQTVLGHTTIDSTLEDEQVIVPLSVAGDGGLDLEAHLVGEANDIVIGEAFPEDIETLSSDTATAFAAQIDVGPLVYEDSTDDIHLEQLTFIGGPSSPDPSITVAVYDRTDDGDLQYLGSGAFTSGESSDITISLDEPLAVGEYDLVLRLHTSDMGLPGDAYEQVIGEEIEPYEVTVPTSVIETAQFSIESIEYDSPVIQGESIELTVTITNEGTVAGSQTLWVSMGDRIFLNDIDLDPGEVGTVNVSVPLDGDTLGNILLELEIGNDADSITVNVEPTEDEPSDDEIIPGFTVLVALLALLGGALLARLRT